MFYIDESGSMPKFRDARNKNRYFVISFVQTDDPRHLKSTYKRAMRVLRRQFPEFFARINDPRECKASEMPPFMKYYLLKQLITVTDIKIGHMVVNNMEIDQVFREKPGRSFNYLIKIIMENFSLSQNDIASLQLNVDNRNTALTGLSELEGYLYYALVLDKGIISDVKVTYLESCDNYNIQVADLFANVIYQRFRYKQMPFPLYNEITKESNLSCAYSYECLYQLIRPKITVPFVFPVRSDMISEASSTFEL
ncbi:hypothetical protein P40081_01170 [Paenibacillus sp. FSL P4-0081]|uniref:DUF3800 domain-containing protein n=1 Tax=Paenibacillus sp. FSL P4-0081 TaxID=1536769 RepID=UPI0004F7ADDF|nr:DUF3800 domain-containing protein [Paenibacillus sp. FSL P4-0081]AIQ26971.1 hypothetical protein P40081_01170 [Paenibacillus sp. FSL P4-0081]